ncbi:AAA family ATPase [Streptomyces afghaniensis]|uniref:AAA family ATPase n=1 Tax=Streptomyces afghaniensis TaxID=66865 RepID=UPI00277EC437|nr:LuxR family transcriptional regulator [Streptomyces afghaniensis]MDQ1014232.1 DNA-binding CsgD family transcriptional regulator [Streptomyces afghaniensis]
MLLEREQELTVLDKAVSHAPSGTGALVLVEGGVGAGTTALLNRLADRAAAAGALVLRSSGIPGERAVPFGVLRQLVLPLLAERHLLPPPLAAASAVAPGTSHANPGGETGAAVRADTLHWMHILFAGLSAERPVVLAVDDLAWVDNASLEALVHLAARLDGLGLLLAVVRKDGLGAHDALISEIAAAATHRVRAHALSRCATATLVARHFGADCPDEFSRTCHDLTGGRPKDLMVLCDRARLRRLGAPHWHTSRLRELGESLRRERLLLLLRREPALDSFLKATAVLADHATDDVVARLAGLSRQQCEHAREVLTHAWHPAHGQGEAAHTREACAVVLQAMGDGESSRRHREASALLDASGAGPEEVAVPLLHVDRLGDEWEIHQLRAAAAAARRRGAPEAAVRYLSRALVDVPASSHVRAELLYELGVTELDLKSPVAGRHFVQAARLMPRILRRAEVVSSIPMDIVRSDPQIADLVRETAVALGTPREDDRQGRYLAMRLEARARYAGLEDPGLVTSAARRLQELGEQPYGASAAERELRTVLLFTAAMCGQTDHGTVARMARQVLDEEPAHASPSGLALEMLPPVLYCTDTPHTAMSWLDAARLHAAQEGNRSTLARVEALRGLLQLAGGEVGLARERGVRALALAEGATYKDRVQPTVVLGRVALELDDCELAGRVLDPTEPPADLRLFALHGVLNGLLAEAQGNLPAALAHYLDCGRVLERAGWVNPAAAPWQVRAALVQHRLGRTAQALATARTHHERALAWGAPSTLSRALRLLGILTGGAAGIELLRQAVDTVETEGSRLELAHGLTELGRRLQQVSNPAGDRMLRRGRQLVTELLNARADAGPGTPPRHARALAAGLTPAETRVAERAARGLSNREIAEELETSLRAVERHLTSSYRKFCITGREQLAQAMGMDDSL